MLNSQEQHDLADLIERIYKMITTQHGTDSHTDSAIDLAQFFDKIQPLVSKLKTYATKIKSSQP